MSTDLLSLFLILQEISHFLFKVILFFKEQSVSITETAERCCGITVHTRNMTLNLILIVEKDDMNSIYSSNSEMRTEMCYINCFLLNDFK